MKGILFDKLAGPIIRHVATSIGAVMVANGWADEATASEITGGLIALAGLGLSWWEKVERSN